jgi:hypothetical protein
VEFDSEIQIVQPQKTNTYTNVASSEGASTSCGRMAVNRSRSERL